MLESVGNVVLLEHLNLNVTDHLSTLWFYLYGLGFTRDPYLPPMNTIAWLNLGYQQLHLPLSPTKQVFGGVIGLIVPDLPRYTGSLEQAGEMVRAANNEGKLSWRLRSIPPSDHHLPFLTPEEQDPKQPPTTKEPTQKRVFLEVVDPNGNVFHLHENYPELDFRGGLGISYLEVRCPVGSAKHIARWYRYILKAIATTKTNPAFSKTRRRGVKEVEDQEQESLGYNGKEVKVVVGPKQWLIYREAEDFTFDGGYHICIYITDFEEAYQRVKELGLLYNEHHYLDRASTLQEARHYHQFRIRDIVELEEVENHQQVENDHHQQNGHHHQPLQNEHQDVGEEEEYEEVAVERPQSRAHAGKLLLRFEHEVRSLQHPLYMRPLVNRFGSAGIEENVFN